MTKTILLTALLYLTCLSFTIAQDRQFGLTVEFGQGWNTFFDLTEGKSRFSLARAIGIYQQGQITSQSAWEIQLLFGSWAGGQKTYSETLSGSNPVQLTRVDSKTRTSISYLGIPISYVLVGQKLSFIAGPQISYVLSSKVVDKGTITSDLEVSNFSSSSEIGNLKSFAFGMRVSAHYKIEDRSRIFLAYYHGINDLLEDNSLSLSMNVRQITLGVTYSL